jgi:hypothetical protein
MAQVPRGTDGKHQLGGSKDAELEGLAPKYSVFTDEEKLNAAERDFPRSQGYTWFTSFTIKENGNDVRGDLTTEYTLKFDKPDDNPDGTRAKLYYYLQGDRGKKGTIHEIQFSDTDNKGNKKRVKANLRIGDPPVGTVP